MKRNYSHSAYMIPSETGLVEEFFENHSYAEFLHHADMVRYRLDELEAAGKIEGMASYTVLAALQDAQYTGVFFKVQFYIHQLDAMLETLPAHEAAKPGILARLFAA